MISWGGSFFSNPFGSLIVKATHVQEEVLVTELDLAKTDSYRTHSPFFRDRRLARYSDIVMPFLY